MRPVPQISSLARIATLIVAAGLVAAQPDSLGLAQSSSAAAVKAKGLELLFGRLKTAKDEYEAGKIEDEILELWHQSGAPEIDELATQAINLMVENKLPSALRVLDDIVQRAPDWAQGWNMRATVHYISGDFYHALADIDRVLALEPRHFGALSTLGAVRMRRGEHGEALAAYRRALAINPFLQEAIDRILELEKKVGDRPH